MHRILRFAAAFLSFVSLEASAFGIGLPPPGITVVEYRNTILDHYFLTANTEEIKLIDAGVAGPGWIKTGRAFQAYAYLNSWCPGCVPIARFYGFGPNSHVYSENPDEVAILRDPASGWILENLSAFVAVSRDANGACPASAPVAVRRLYNNRYMFNDSNHRYVIRDSDRDAMLAAGWLDEGVHFCALAEMEVPVKSFSIDAPLDGNILPSAQCEDEAVRVGPCIAINNLPSPRTSIPLANFPAADRQRFVDLTGMFTQTAFVTRLGGAELSEEPFLQGPLEYTIDTITSNSRYGIHVDTRGKGPDQFSSINPLYQFRTQPTDGDARFFPWRAGYPFETELSISSVIQVLRTYARTPASHYTGHPTLEFIDTRSGDHLYFTVSVYSETPDVGSDYLARDVGTGKVIVGTSHRAATPYGRSLGASSLYTPHGFVGSVGGIFDFRMDRIEFGRVLDAARSLDPALSSDPGDYLLDNFHFNNEILGDGELGLNVGLTLRVMRR